MSHQPCRNYEEYLALGKKPYNEKKYGIPGSGSAVVQVTGIYLADSKVFGNLGAKCPGERCEMAPRFPDTFESDKYSSKTRTFESEFCMGGQTRIDNLPTNSSSLCSGSLCL